MDVGGIFATLGLDTQPFVSDLARAREAMKILDSEVERLRSDLASGAIGWKVYSDQMRDVMTASNTIRGTIRDVGREFSLSGQQMQKFAYLVDDLQYLEEQGLRPILNNLTQIHPMVGIVAIAGNTLYKNWDRLKEVIGAGRTRTEAEDMERLAKATEKTADEGERVNEYKRRGKLLDQTSDPTKLRKEASQAAVEAIQNAGGQAGFIKAIDETRTAGGRAQFTEDEQRDINYIKTGKGKRTPILTDLMEAATGETKEARGERLMGEVLKRAQIRREKEIAEQLGRALEDTGGADMKALIGEVGKNTKRFAPGLAGDLMASDPADIARQKALDDAGEVNAENMEKRAADKKKADAEKKRADHEKQVEIDKQAKDLMPGGLLGDYALSEDAVADQLSQAAGEPVPKEHAAAVFKALMRQYEEAIASEARQNGGDRDAAIALLSRRAADERFRDKKPSMEDAANARGEKREQTAEQRAHDREVREIVAEFAPDMKGKIDSGIKHANRIGADPERADEELRAKVQQALVGRVADALLGDVAAELVRRRRNDFVGKMAGKALNARPVGAGVGAPAPAAKRKGAAPAKNPHRARDAARAAKNRGNPEVTQAMREMSAKFADLSGKFGKLLTDGISLKA